MPRRKPKPPTLSRLEANQVAISQAWRDVHRTPLRALARSVTYLPCTGESGDPEIGCIDPLSAQVRLNPHIARWVSAGEWAAHIGHLLLHLELNHSSRREDRDPVIWNYACEAASDRLLPLFGLRGGDLVKAEIGLEEDAYEA